MDIIRIPFRALAITILVAATLVACLLILRVIFAWSGANPFGRFSYNLTRLTEPLVRPLRYQFFGRAQRHDLMPMVMGIMVLAAGFVTCSIVWQIGDKVADFSNTATAGSLTLRYVARELVDLLALLYVAAILSRFVVQILGIGYSSKILRFAFTITEPLLKPLRRYFVVNRMDCSPIILMIIVEVVRQLLMKSLQ